MTRLISDCEEPAASDNGWFELTTDRVTAHFLCLTGYTLRGAEILTCQSNGSGWDLVPPVCGECINELCRLQ